MKPTHRESRAAELRRLAEARLAARGPRDTALDHADALRLVHELEVHETELELQFDEVTRAHEAAEAALERAVDLYEGAPFAYFTVAADGSISQVNAAAERMLGRTRRELIGHPLAGLVIAADQEALLGLLAAARDGTPLAARELALTPREGEDQGRFAELSACRAPRGEECHVAAVDVSQRRLSEQRLRESEKLAAVGRLAAGIAHDFNNLLAVILAHVELASQDPRGDSVADDLEGVKQAAERGAALSRQLLAFGRGQPSHPIQIDVNAAITSLGAMLRRLVDVNVDIVCDLDPGSPWVEADPSLLDQLVVNLALNARDAMPAGGTLRLSTGSVDVVVDGNPVTSDAKVGRFVRISVSDTGTGMDAATRERIFEPFFTTRREQGGTGLGLSTVWSVVSGIGGTITVRSELGSGTTFDVHLPRAAEPVTVRPKAIAREPIPRMFNGETVLVVDDMAGLRTLVARTLTALGLTVLTAKNGLDALAVAAGHVGRIDLLLTDVHMPKLAGGGLVAAMQESRPDTRVLFMTGDVSDAMGRLGAAANTRILAKPFSASALGVAIREVLYAGARTD